MTTKKSTKRALFMSALALLMCFSMLIGTTYAWFTDSVTSGNNIIKSGNLDVELEYKKVVDGVITDWDDVSGKDQLFDKNALWEPGHTEVVFLKVSNVGTLDLKYQLGVNIIKEIGSTNVYDEEFKLSDYLVFKVLTSNEEFDYENYNTREKVVAAAAGTERGLKDYNGTTTKLADKEVDYLALIVYMPTDVDNKANYKKGFDAPYIELGVNLYATQVEAETDSFGNDYDKDAWVDGMKVYDANDLQAALNNGATNIVLMDDIAAEKSIVIPANAKVKLDLNGKDLSLGAYYIENQGELVLTNGAAVADTFNDTTAGAPVWNNGGKLTVTEGTEIVGVCAAIRNENGEVSVNGGELEATCTLGYTSRIIYNKSGSVTINGGTFDGCHSTNSSEGCSIVGGKGTTVINGGYFSDFSCVPNSIFSYNTDTTVKGGTFAFVPYDNWTYEQSFTIGDYLADGFIVVDNGDGTYTVVPDGMTLVEGYPHLYTNGANNYYVYDVQGLASLNNWLNMWNAYGNTFNVMADINASGYTWNCKMIAPNGDNTPGFTFNGNDHTISNLTIAGGGLFTLTPNGTYATVPTTIKDITFDNATVTGGYHTGVVWGQVSGDLVLNDVHVTNSNVTGEYNVGGLVGSTGEFNIDASVKYVDCSVTNTTLTANGAAGGDPTGASAFMGRALGDTSLVFEGNNVADDNTYVNENGLVGGGIYGYTTWANGGFVGTGKCDTFTAWKGTTALAEGESLSEALKESSNVVLPAGEYKLPTTTDRTVVISGTADTVINLSSGTGQMHNMTYVFDGVTIKGATALYKGIFHAASVAYKNCTLTGLQFLYAETVTFENCDFDSEGEEHSIWTYGSKNISFTDCDFTYGDRAVNVYLDNGTGSVNVSFDGCSFNTTNTASKGAVEINSSVFPQGANVSFVDCTAPAYGTMVGISGWDGTNGATANVTVNGAAFTAPQWTK